MSARGLVSLSMILKNEAHGIARTLASVKPHVERWCILDTGSADGTQDRVRAAMRGVPGELHEEPFVDFATTRNRALDLCGADTEFTLWLDADDELKGGRELAEFLRRERGRASAEEAAYYVRVEMAGTVFDSARVLRSGSGWRFEGRVHEVLTHPRRPAPSPRIEGVTIVHAIDDRSQERSRARWERDLVLLEQDVAANPSAARPAFYLAMTLLWLGRYEEAIRAFDRRVALGGWAEEVYCARLSKARAAKAARRPWPEVLALFLDAHAAAPQRAEPLFDVATHYDAEGNHALALLFARRAYELPLPATDILFVEHEVYEWRAADLVGTHAYWLGERALGERAARQAADARKGDERLARNLGFYVGKGGP